MSLEFLSLSHRNSPGKTSLAAKSKEKRLYSQATMYQSIPKLPICNLHISHNTPCLPPKTLHNLCFKFLLGITVALREILDKLLMQNYGGETRCTCIMEDMQTVNSCLCENSEHLNFWKILVKFPFYVGRLDGQMPHQSTLQKASPTSHASSHLIDRRLTSNWISLHYSWL